MKPAHLLAALSLLACDEGAGTTAPPPEATRVVAVAAPKAQASESDLCDVLKTPESAPAFVFPSLDGPAPAAANGWRWVNVWATWCPPCIEELPLITRFRDTLAGAGAQVQLDLLSVDQTAEVVQQFAAQHAEVRSSLRVSEPSVLEPWLTNIGLDAGATLPIHLFVDPAGKVRCARTGALRESDLPLVKRLIGG